ncbi:hypothetical protein P691DRAFT_773071 [Macrolepiota fuliginosa MF-IS2]|uniref:Uncharacterized protein n=1 Tax=Macrolepiota fuliginosa MF-IS2 TaxID=1400762 RepID=A0A9P5XHK9_9AGAR|nr:hypothetical protein P691DRAFT_773071 [Macrolepiota fuliginosa MF-IS2]
MLQSTTRALRPSVTTVKRSISRTGVCWYSNLNTNSSPRPSTSSSTSFKQASGSHWKGQSRIKEGVPTVLIENRCAFVRTWDFLRNPAEALALVRAVEQKYGPVESFSFQKDFDSPSLYQSHVKITFRDIESFHRLPEDFQTLHIRAPKVQPKRPGGIGLDEIHHLVTEDVEFLTADKVSEIASEERTIDFRIERAQRAYFEESPFRFVGVNQTYRKEIGTKMLEWGGFHEMEPMDSTQPITNEELTEETLDHVHMRRSLREWSQYLGVRNPYEVYPADAKEKRPVVPAEKTTDTQTVKSNTTPAEDANPQKSEAASLEEWLSSDVPQPKVTREPIELILEMEDIQAAAKVPEEVEIKDALAEEIMPPASSTSSTTLPGETTVSTTQTTTTQPVDSPPSATEPQPSSSSPLPEQSTPPEAFTPGPTETQASSPPPPPPKHQKSKAEQKELSAQLQEARRLGDLVRSPKKPKSTPASEKQPKDKTAVQEVKEINAKEVTEPGVQDESSNLEANPRFGNFFDKLQEIFKKS